MNTFSERRDPVGGITFMWSSVCWVRGEGGGVPGGASERDSDSAPRPAAPFTNTEPTEPTPPTPATEPPSAWL